MKTKFVFSCILLLYLLIAFPIYAQVERIEKGSLVIEGVPEIPQQIVDRMQQYQNTRSAGLADWDPVKGGILIRTRFGETGQFHYVEKPMGARTQITFFSEPVSGGTICPDKKRNGYLFSKDIGGGENYQVFYFDLKDGSYKMLTDGQSRNGGPNWSNSGELFTYYSTKRNSRDCDIYIADVDNPADAKRVTENSGLWLAVDWSPDDNKLLVLNYISANESYYHIYDIKTGSLTQINPSEKKISYDAALWSKDGKGLYITSDEDSEFQRLRYYDLSSKSFTILTADIPWDISEIELNNKGDKLAFVVNEDGIRALYLLDTKSNDYKKVGGIPVGQIYGLNFHPDGGRLGLTINTAQTPGDIYVLDLTDFSLERWTSSEVGGLKTEIFAVPELIHYPTFDEVDGEPRMIPAFYFKPSNGKAPYPVVISIHGGPEGQFNPYFSSTYQYWLNELGIALIAPNVRGSAGYGKSYLKMDNGYKREDSVKDIGKLLDWIEQQPELDANKICVYGGSYGGYMVLSSLTHYNDRLTCGIDVVGISNFVTFLENTKEYRRDLRRVEYGDERDPEMRAFLNKISPTMNAQKITKPLFIIQGLNDPRVPVTESEQMVSKIRENGSPVWYLMAKDEGHGFRKKKNRDYTSNAVVLFLETHLLNGNQ
jgi:dipeptidyl aminopeptidase/acylaminoacyl peptidase